MSDGEEESLSRFYGRNSIMQMHLCNELKIIFHFQICSVFTRGPSAWLTTLGPITRDKPLSFLENQIRDHPYVETRHNWPLITM